MTTVDRSTLYPLITAGQAAVRAAENHGTPEALAAVDRALCELPVNLLDTPADETLHGALHAVSLAEDAEEWKLLADVEHAVSLLLHKPDGLTLEHPAVMAVGKLAIRCSVAGEDAGASVARAWHRGYLLGMEALRAVSGTIYGSTDGRALDKAVMEFRAAVRRAVPYAALRKTRLALVEAARSYSLFPIGMRQAMSPSSRWGWSRRIGTSTYHFEIEPPLFHGHPYGSVAVRRTAADGTAGPVRYFPLGADEERRRAVTEAQYRI
ncbi:hypothetical protein [Streptomyces virginiae]|uniref:hypothetical protein n=1 Tax=Streptomyces virginiae TaxID=1961 RepID=UPI00364A9D15